MIKSLFYAGDKSIGESIRDLRVSKGLSITDLSRMVGTTAAAISRYEKNKRIPSVETYKKIMTALGAELTVIEK
jgi:transcriptional regulator with XRE-family HTH domain